MNEWDAENAEYDPSESGLKALSHRFKLLESVCNYESSNKI